MSEYEHTEHLLIQIDYLRTANRQLREYAEDAVAKIKRLEELGNKLRECASQLGWTSSEDPRWIERAEAAVKAWDKEAKP